MDSSGKNKCAICGHVCQDGRGLAVHMSQCKGKSSLSDRPGRANRLKNLKRISEAAHNRNDVAPEGDIYFSAEYDDSAQNGSGMDFDGYETGTAAAGPPNPPPLLDAPPELPAGTKRRRRLPKKFKDHMPSCSTSTILPTVSLPHLLDHIPAPEPPEPPEDLQSVAREPQHVSSPPVPVFEDFETPPNSFGAFRVYASKPEDDPDSCLDLDDLCNFRPVVSKPKPSLPPTISNIYAPFESASVFFLICWMNRESKMKTYEEIDHLVHDVLLHPDFNVQDLRDFTAKREHDRFDSYIKNPADQNDMKPLDGWRTGSVRIKLPAEDGKRRTEGESGAPEFEIQDINYQPIMETLYKTLDDPEAPAFHYSPFREFWQPDYLSEPERIYGEFYSSDLWIESHEQLQRLPKINGIDNFVLPILLYSDSTHLTNFGSASLWPLYMYLGSQSKYLRCTNVSSACSHLAYIPSLPPSVQDAYKQQYGRGASSQVLTHLRRELMQAVLSLVVLQPDFLEFYENGFPFLCSDGVTRRLFPRVMAYSADYPERMLIATLKNMGAFPCASCETPTKYIHMLGTTADEQRRAHKRVDDIRKQDRIENARRWIFENGHRVDSARVKGCLGPHSLIPTRNAFSSFSKFGFNFHDIFTPDLMHEFELGVWKRAFIHLIRILVAQGGDSISTLNTRYRLVPPFGRNTIRRFPQSTAAMTKLAARDYEDILQCSIPVFNGLIPEIRHNKIILDLLFTLCSWHAFAKLRLHTETSVRLLDDATKELGRQLRNFKKETSVYDTRELQKEVEARGRRNTAFVKQDNPRTQTGPKRVELNLNIPKLHALGKYASAIPRYGSTDSYSTQNGESQHKRVKRMFGRTNKRNAARDVAKLEIRARKLKELKLQIERARHLGNASPESFRKFCPESHYWLPRSKKHWDYISRWCQTHETNLAVKNFWNRLRSHILSRLLSRNESEPFSSNELAGLSIKNDKIYWHKVFRVNYTTYDIRREQDCLGMRSKSNVMLLDSDSDCHPYAYARILGIFHVDIAYSGPASTHEIYKRVDVLWVHWYQLSSTNSFSFPSKRLPTLEFAPYNEPGSSGFVDPDLIVRGTHLIPDFSQGTIPNPFSLHGESTGEEYQYYYVNIFVDRDMFMRYRGGGVGHKITKHLNRRLLDDFLNPIAPEMAPEDEEEEIDPMEQEHDEIMGDMQSEPESEDNEYMTDEGDGDASGNEVDEEEREEGAESDGYAEL